jgi:hypothetical protein
VYNLIYSTIMQAELGGMGRESVGSTSVGDVSSMEDEDIYKFP